VSSAGFKEGEQAEGNDNIFFMYCSLVHGMALVGATWLLLGLVKFVKSCGRGRITFGKQTKKTKTMPPPQKQKDDVIVPQPPVPAYVHACEDSKVFHIREDCPALKNANSTKRRPCGRCSMNQ